MLMVERFVNLDELIALEADARADGLKRVTRFIEEWSDGRNSFAGPGEKSYMVRLAGRVCSVCGLNRDPFAGDDSIGRVRRLYVAVLAIGFERVVGDDNCTHRCRVASA